jgi:hypothetical protein
MEKELERKERKNVPINILFRKRKAWNIVRRKTYIRCSSNNNNLGSIPN